MAVCYDKLQMLLSRFALLRWNNVYKKHCIVNYMALFL